MSPRFTSLSFLLFLHTFLSDGGGTQVWAQASGSYRSPCISNSECEDTNWCNPETGKCDCLELQSYNKELNLAQIFHEVQKKCFSPIGSACILDDYPQKKRGYPLVCVPNSHCRRPFTLLAPRYFGVCECAPNYTKDYQGLCEKVEETLNLGVVWSSEFSGHNGLPEKPIAQKFGDDVTNENKHFHLDERKLAKISRSEGKAEKFNLLLLGGSVFTLFLVNS